MRRLNARKRVGSSPNQMDPTITTKLQIRSTNLFARHNNNNNTSKSVFLVPLFFSLLLILSYYTFFSSSGTGFRYRIIVDGGSTGTRVHVFKYRVNKALDFGNEGLASMRVNPGLSAFAEDLEGAGRSLSELVEFAKARIPRESWSETEIRLMATAGMRILEAEVQEKILESCRKVLRVSGFKFRDDWASVITGSDEGVYAWVVANYALGTLGSDPSDTTGIIELGGASAQVTFVSREAMLPLFSRAVKFGNVTYNLYSHSLLHLGLNVAHDSWREALISEDFNMASQYIQEGLRIDPCTPAGYSYNVDSGKFSPGSDSEKSHLQSKVQTRGNFSECRSAALMLLQKGKESCSYQHCDIGSTFIPKLQGKFLATENFFHTSKTQAKFGFGVQTAYLSVTYFDRFLSKRSIHESKPWAIQLLSVACLSLAAKMEEQRVPLLSEYPIEEYRFENKVIKNMELLILSTLEWKMGSPTTPFAYLHYFFTKFCTDSRSEKIITQATEHIVAILKDVNLMDQRPSIIASAAILAASDSTLTKKAIDIRISVISSWGNVESGNVFSCYNLAFRKGIL